MASNCRFCGAPHDWQDQVQRPAWERQASDEGWSKFSQFNAGTVSQALATGATYEKRHPVRAAKREADVVVPFLQSLISGGVGGVGVGTAAGLFGAGWDSLLWAGVGAAFGTGLAWIILLGEHRKGLWNVERIVGKDASSKADKQTQSAKREPIRVETLERSKYGHTRGMEYVSLPANVSESDVARLAHAILTDGCKFSRRELADVLSSDKFSGVQKAMLQGGLAQFANGRNKSSGVVVTGSGRAFLRYFVA